MKSPADMMADGAGAARNGYCEHPSARHFRLYVPYADANTIRLRASQALGREAVHVSWLYEIPGGWGWTICRECRARDRRPA